MAEMPTPEAPALPDIEFVVAEDSEAELDPPHHVIIHNDDVTPMDFVTTILQGIFELTYWDATAIMIKAHLKGQAVVVISYGNRGFLGLVMPISVDSWPWGLGPEDSG